MPESKTMGRIAWCDLTIANAEEVRDFYETVAGWTAEPVSLGDYEDYSMVPSGGKEAVAGICHAKGINAELPPVWLIHITVEDLAASLEKVEAQGGRIVRRQSELAVIQDPSGAHCALYQGRENS